MARDSNLRHIAKVRPGWPLLYLHHKASQSSRQSQHGSPELSVSFGNSKQTELKTTKPLKVGNQGFTHSRQFQAPTSATPSCLYLQSRRQSRPQLPLPSRIRKSPHRPRRFSLSRGLRNLKVLGMLWGPWGWCRWDVCFRGKKHLKQSDSPASPLELPVQPSDP